MGEVAELSASEGAVWAILSQSIESSRERQGNPAHFIYYEWLARRAVILGDQKAWYRKKEWDEMKSATGGQLLEPTSDFQLAPSEDPASPRIPGPVTTAEPEATG